MGMSLSEKQKRNIKLGVRLILQGLGENLNSEHLKDTPERIARLYSNLFVGYGPKLKIEDIRKFENTKGVNDVQVRKCEFLSFCPHHMQPYSGVVYVGYLPDKYLVGMDKIDLVVDYFAGRLGIQEDMVHDVADFLIKCFKPKGIMVQAYAIHYCALCKGNPGSFASSAVRGVYEKRENAHLKMETFEMFKRLDSMEG